MAPTLLPVVSPARCSVQHCRQRQAEPLPASLLSSRRAALTLLATVSLSPQLPALASYSDVANQKALAKAQLLEDARARAEGRQPRPLAPAIPGDSPVPAAAKSANKASVVGAPTASAIEQPAASFSDAARERASAKAALLAETRQKALASGGNVVKTKK